MPIANQISTAAQSYNRTAAIFGKVVDGLTQEEWQRRPDPGSNPVFWVAGHLVWARSQVLHLLGKEWSRPWLSLFATGSTLDDAAKYPSSEEILSGWQDVSTRLTAALESAPADKLAAPAPEKSPSFDGTVGGLVSFLALHEGYHVGQASYLRCWMGHKGVLG